MNTFFAIKIPLFEDGTELSGFYAMPHQLRLFPSRKDAEEASTAWMREMAPKVALLAQILPADKAELLRCEIVEVGVMIFAEKEGAAKQ